VSLADRELHADAAASDAAADELGPERPGVRLADVEADYLSAPGLVHGVRDHKALAYKPPAVADLLDLRVEPQIGKKRPSSRRPLNAWALL